MMHDNTGSSGLSFLASGGEAGALMRSMDWTASPLGSPRHWPQSLRTVVSLLLNSKFPMFVAWGPELGFLYNDGYAEILGTKHPAAIGGRFKDIWSEIWPDIEPLISRALAGEATFHEDLPLVMRRRGFDEQTYFTFSYSPVHDESGGIGGMFCACTETTQEVERRAALLADREHLHRLFQQAPSMVCILSGPEHIFELANPIYLEFIGKRDVIGRKLREAVPELEGQGFLELLDNVYATGQPFVGRQMPVTAQPQDGSPAQTRYFDFVYQPVTDEQGTVTGIFAEGHDVTEQVCAQTSLRESEERFRMFSEETREGVVIHNGQTVFDCNSAFARMFGYEGVEEVIGRPTTEFVTSKSMAMIREANLLKQEQPYNVEARRKDGSTFPAEFVGRETAWRGQPVRIGLARDLTQQHRAEAAIKASLARHEAAVRASGHLFYDWKSDTNALTFGDNIERILGYTAAEMNGGLARWLEIVHPEDQRAFSTEISRVLATGEPFRLDFRIICKDGRIIEVEDEGYFLHGVQGHIEHMVGFVRDVTARKQAERDREAERARLEAVLRQSPVGIIIAEAPSGRLVLGNEQVAQIMRHEFQAASEVEEYRVYRGFERGTGRELEPGDWPLARSITAGELVMNEEIDIERGDGSLGTVMVNSTPIYDEQNRIVAGVVVFSDITERAEAERHQSLLIHELNHRVKNTLATVQSVAAQSFRNIGEEARPNLKTFEERLFALARAHDVLTREHWEGAELREIIAEVLEPYLRQAVGRFEINGPRLRLTPSMALAFAMAVHELATNATKYGALSVPSGRVSINWSTAGHTSPLLTLRWEEHDGPAVVPPSRKGFGTRLIERVLASELSGEVRLSYEPSGVVCKVTVPLQNEEPSSKNRAVA